MDSCKNLLTAESLARMLLIFKTPQVAHKTGKQGKCIHTCDFCAPAGPQKRLLGNLPKPDCLRPCATAKGLIFSRSTSGHRDQKRNR